MKPQRKKPVEDFKPAPSAEENAGGTAFVDMASMFGSEGGSAGTMNVDMDEFLGEDPEAGKKAAQKIALISGAAIFLIIIIGTIIYISQPTTKNVREAPLGVGATRNLSVVPYGNLEFDDAKVSIEEMTIDDNPSLKIVGIEVGDAIITLTDYQGNFTIYTIPIEEKQVDVWKLEIQHKYSGKSESAKVKIAKEWMEFGKHRLKQKEIERSCYFDAFEKFYLTELILKTLDNPPALYKEARRMREEMMEELDRIYKLKKREIQNALKVKDKKKAKEGIEFLKQTFPSEKYFNLNTKENYRKAITWLEDGVEKKARR